MRAEKDFIGQLQIPKNALFGIHSVRAKNNFPANDRFEYEWYKALGITKLACYNTYTQFKEAVSSKYGKELKKINLMPDNILSALKAAATEISEGKHFEHFIVSATQGGAGTSINMNINEIITNLALLKLGKKPGNYQHIHPIEHANIYQSTNDVVPTSLKVAAMGLLLVLEEKINDLRFKIEKLESEHRYSLRSAYTQLQLAVPSSFGILFSAYNEALSRDWWRVSKTLERIKTVNLGGGATGSSLSLPRFYVMKVVNELQKLTKLPLARSENMADATQNHESLVEIHAILKAHAVNLEKIVNDIRFLSSDAGSKQIQIPEKQTGSSIMPGKVNPVIPEFIISIAHQIYANDTLITSLSGQAMLDLNAYIPQIGNALLKSIQLLIAANTSLLENLFNDLQIHTVKTKTELYENPAVSTALIPLIGYNKASELAQLMKDKKLNIFEANKKAGYLPAEKLNEILKAENLLKQGFSLNDL